MLSSASKKPTKGRTLKGIGQLIEAKIKSILRRSSKWWRTRWSQSWRENQANAEPLNTNSSTRKTIARISGPHLASSSNCTTKNTVKPRGKQKNCLTWRWKAKRSLGWVPFRKKRSKKSGKSKNKFPTQKAALSCPLEHLCPKGSHSGSQKPWIQLKSWRKKNPTTNRNLKTTAPTTKTKNSWLQTAVQPQ